MPATYSSHRFKAFVVSFDGLDLVFSRVSSVSIANKRNMSRDRSLTERADE